MEVHLKHSDGVEYSAVISDRFDPKIGQEYGLQLCRLMILDEHPGPAALKSPRYVPDDDEDDTECRPRNLKLTPWSRCVVI